MWYLPAKANIGLLASQHLASLYLGSRKQRHLAAKDKIRFPVASRRAFFPPISTFLFSPSLLPRGVYGLSPVHTSNNIEATLSNVTSRTSLSTESNVTSTKSNAASTLLPFLVTMLPFFGNNVERNFVLSTKSKHIEHVQFVSTLSKGRNFTKNSFDIVAVFCQQVECCFDIVAGVDGALDTRITGHIMLRSLPNLIIFGRNYTKEVSNNQTVTYFLA